MNDELTPEVGLKQKPSYNIQFILMVTFAAAMGGLLFGYDWVVIGGAKLFYEDFFGIKDIPAMVGWAQSCAVVGCMLGALVSGSLSDAFGRKKLLLLAGFLFFISAVGTGLANTFSFFVVSRLVGGIGMGLASGLSPVYIAEISPAEMRGRFVALNQLAIVIGIQGAQLINWWIAEPVAETATAAEILASWNGQTGWRWMFWGEALPALLFLVAMLFAPESPRWLIKNAAFDRARLILSKVGGKDYADYEVNDIKATLENEIQRVQFTDLLAPKLLKIVILGCFLAVFQQWCGINVVFQYAEEVFEGAGLSVDSTMFSIVISGSVFLVFTFLAIATVDNLGRKKLMLTGAMGLCITYILLGGCYKFDVIGLPAVLLVMIAIAFYAFTLAPVTWVLLSELFPNRIRGAAMSVAVFAIWFGNLTLTQTFPILNDKLNTYGTFWLYAAVCAVGFVIMLKKVPETKGKTLEEIERELVD